MLKRLKKNSDTLLLIFLQSTVNERFMENLFKNKRGLYDSYIKSKIILVRNY